MTLNNLISGLSRYSHQRVSKKVEAIDVVAYEAIDRETTRYREKSDGAGRGLCNRGLLAINLASRMCPLRRARYTSVSASDR